MNKFLVLLLLSCLVVFSAADQVPPGFDGDETVECEAKCQFGTDFLKDADCTGFKIRNDELWDDFAILQQKSNGQFECVEAVDADDPFDFNSNYLCCAESEEDCCKDYPAGFYAGFGIGIGGIAFMILYAVYLCFGSSSPKTEA